MIYTSKCPEDTMNIANKLAKSFKGGEILILNGELGAGKTTFTKGIAQGLNVDDIITSPTFTIMNEYRGRLNLYHYDMYRVEDLSELDELGIDEYLYADGVAVIEWNKYNLSNDKVIRVNIEYIDDVSRRITIIWTA